MPEDWRRVARIEDHPHFALLKALKAREGRSLMDRYGAHALGIGWRQGTGGRVPALVFYIDVAADLTGRPPVPATLEFDPGGGRSPVTFTCAVVISPTATEETDEG